METVRIFKNAHHLLGLPTGIDLAEIKRRTNHLLNLARIEETERYDTDIPGIATLRTEQNISKALEHLSTVRTRLIESIFWFEIPTIQDHKYMKDLANGDFKEAIRYWCGLSSGSPINWIAKKNEALAYFIYAFQGGQNNHFEKSLTLWREIINSDQFWVFYEEHYKITDDLGTDCSLFAELRAKMFEYLSYLALELHTKYQDPSIVKILFVQTGVLGKVIEEQILKPLISKITDNLDELSKIKNDPIRQRTAKIVLECSMVELSNFGVNDYSPVKALRENCAARCRAISIELHNEENNIELANELLDVGTSISSSESYLLQVQLDKEQLENNKEFNNFIETLQKLDDKTPYDKWIAFKEIEPTISNQLKLESAFIEIKSGLLIGYAVDEFTKNRDDLFNKKEDQARSNMSVIHNELCDNIGIFNLNEDKVYEMRDDFLARTRAVSSPEEMPLIEDNIKWVIKIADKSKLDEKSKLALIILCQSVIYSDIAPYIRDLRYANYLVTLGNYTVICYGLGLIFWIAAYCLRRR